MEEPIIKVETTTVTIRVNDGSCIVDPCDLTVSRGDRVRFELQSGATQLDRVEVTTGAEPLLCNGNRRVPRFDLRPGQDPRYLEVCDAAKSGRHQYSVQAHYVGGGSPIKGGCPEPDAEVASLSTESTEDTAKGTTVGPVRDPVMIVQ